MKKQKQLIVWFLGVFLMLFSITVKAQAPTYQARIQNAAQVNCNTYEFDILLWRTSSATVWKLGGIQCGITFNPAMIPSGASLDISPVPGSSAITDPNQVPGAVNFSATNNVIKITAVSPVGLANAYSVPLNTPTHRFIRVRVSCSQPFNTVSTTHAWSFAINPYPTKFFYYNTSGQLFDMTVQASHQVNSTSGNVTLAGGFTEPLPQTISADNLNACSISGGSTITVDNTQAGYSYYLYIDGVQVPNPSGSGNPGVVYGNGGPKSFGKKVLGGVVTVQVAGCSGTINMLNSLTIVPLTPVTASVSIAANPGNVVPPGTLVTYTATPVNGGTTPTYQWFVNTTPDLVNGLSSTYIYTPLHNDKLYCEMTSSEPCFTPAVATSDTITMTVALPPSAYTVTSNGTSYCQGTTGVEIGLSNSQTGVTYTLFKNTVAQTPTVAGTGSAISFGNQQAGVYTVSGTGPGGTTPMTGSITVTEIPSAAVSVSVSPSQNNFCAPAVPVTFTALPNNGGTSPVYQWYVNTNPVGTNSDTYSYTPASGDQIYVSLTSNEQCATGSPANSNTVTMNIIPFVTPSVLLSVNQNNICQGTTVNFTATPTNGGSNPNYQWYVGSTPVGSGQNPYTYAPLNGEEISVVLTSSLQCVTGTATSNSITMNTIPTSAVSVLVSANPSGVVCVNTPVTYTAAPTNGGTTPAYQWYVGTTPVGTNVGTYTYNPANNDQIKVVLTSNITCPTGNPATSNIITAIVDPCTGIGENQSDIETMMVYPNPTNDKLFVNYNNLNQTPKSVKIFNTYGQICFESNNPLNDNINGIDVSKYSSGTYTLQVGFENTIINKTFVVQ